MHDCVVIGGGVIGLSLAYELAGSGMRVRVLERGEPGREASWAGAGILPPANLRTARDAVEQLAGLSCELHPRWAAELREATGIDTGYHRCGGVYVARSSANAAELEAAAAEWREREIPVERLTGKELIDAHPAIRGSASAPIMLALHLPGEAQLRNPRHLRALTAACRVRGVEITCGVAAHDFQLRSGRIEAVLTTAGAIRGGALALAGGAWTGPLAARLGCEVPVVPVRGQIALLDARVRPFEPVVNEQGRYLVPRVDGRVLVGSTEEHVGYECRTTAEGIAELLRFAQELVPELAGARVERCWAGLRPGSTTGRPLLGRLAGVENGFVAAGHFRSGLALSTGTAAVMAQLIRGQSPQIDVGAFAPR
jgi:glycine oxidase